MPEWAALELQGELKKWKKDKSAAQQHGDDGDLAKDPADLKLFASSFVAGLKFGLFQIDPKNHSKASIIIGHHKLEGERATLGKPLAVLKKRSGTSGKAVDQETSLPTPGSVKYDVEGVIRWKYIFKDRPRLLISKSKE